MKIKALAIIIAILFSAHGWADVENDGSFNHRNLVHESVDSLRKQIEAQKKSSGEEGDLGESSADKMRKIEQEYQNKLLELDQAVKNLENRIAEFRQLVTPPTKGEIDILNQDLNMVERSLETLGPSAPSALSQLQRTEIQNRLFELQLAVGIMSRRWGDGWKVFGMDFFSAAIPADAPGQEVVPPDYRIRVGDMLEVDVVSPLGDRSVYKPRVDASGNISVTGAGKVRAAGKTAARLRNLLETSLRARFRQLKVDVTVTRMQPVKVQMNGEVARPGSYSLAGTATVFTALYSAGGPTKAGTFRRIELVRSGEPRKIIDLYDFLVKGSKKLDLPLDNGDMIFVPTVGGTIVVEGEVVRPGRYEPDFPITLGEALKLAGGPSPGAYSQSVQVERIENGAYRVLLNESGSGIAGKADFVIKPGDQITVSTVRPDRTNRVAISGPVSAPGLYGLKTGMRVSDLIKLAQGLVHDREIYGARADVLRMDPFKGAQLLTFDLDKALNGDPAQDLLLQKLDQVFLYEPEQVVYRPRFVTVSGGVVKPGTYKRAEGMRVSDAVAAAGGVIPDAYLVRADIRRQIGGGATKLIRVNLKNALSRAAGDDFTLEDRDVITIYTDKQVQWSESTVRVEGAVQQEGVYRRSEGERLSDLLLACGGLLPEAAKTAEIGRCTGMGTVRIIKVDLARLTPGGDQDITLQDRDVIAVPEMNPSLRYPPIVYLSGEVKNPGPYPLKSGEKLIDLIQRAGGLTSLANMRGMMFLRQKEAFENPQQIKDVDLILQKARAFANKQFVAHLAKLGMQLPGPFVEAVQTSADQLAKPPEVVVEKVEDKKKNKSKETDKSEETEKLEEIVTPREMESATALGPRVPELPSLDIQAFVGRKELADLASSSRISVDLEQAFRNPSSPDNMPLRSGDRISIPPITNVVTVIGAVLHPHDFSAGPGKGPDFYIERSGGFASDAAKGSVVVVRANGDALPKNRVPVVEPGDTIVVPTTGIIDIAKKWERVQPATKVLTDVLSSVYILTRF